MTIYRSIWSEHYNQTIPKGWHIHHLDGNHNNNSIENLICVSPHVHWCVHLLQGDPVALKGKFVANCITRGHLGKKHSTETKERLSKNHHNVNGSKNPRAKTYKFTNPNNKEYIVIGEFKKFCKKKNLSWQTMYLRVLKKKQLTTSGKCVGWNVVCVNTN